jgi:peroxiredoxin
VTTTPRDLRTDESGLRQDEELAFRRQFERDGIWSRMVAPGDMLPELPLVEVDLGPIRLDRMRLIGPIVLIFFRYASSPDCNAALGAYAKDLAPALDGLGAHLVAVSPQLPDRLRAVKRRHQLGFFVASDPRHALIDAFNLGFERPGAEELLGTRESVLPLPAAVIVDRAGVVRFVDVPADPAARTPAGVLVGAVSKLC